MNKTAFIFIMLFGLLGSNPAIAAKPKIPTPVHKQLIEVGKLMETESWDESKDILNNLVKATEH
ncbi:MAG: hypothetical protein AAF353_15665, partial [Pseudomonadota bacterium]